MGQWVSVSQDGVETVGLMTKFPGSPDVLLSTGKDYINLGRENSKHTIKKVDKPVGMGANASVLPSTAKAREAIDPPAKEYNTGDWIIGQGAWVETDVGPGIVREVTGRSITIDLDNGDTINLVTGTPGANRLEPYEDSPVGTVREAPGSTTMADNAPATVPAQRGSSKPKRTINLGYLIGDVTVTESRGRRSTIQTRYGEFKLRWARDGFNFRVFVTYGDETRQDLVERLVHWRDIDMMRNRNASVQGLIESFVRDGTANKQ